MICLGGMQTGVDSNDTQNVVKVSGKAYFTSGYVSEEELAGFTNKLV